MPTKLNPMLPPLHTAIIQDENGEPRITEDLPLPSLEAGTVVIKVVAVALNPSDFKMGAAFPIPGAVIGMDFSGFIVSIHPDTKTDLCIGDPVCGGVHGSNPGDPTNGAFAEHASTLGTGLMTNILALWEPSALCLSATPDSPTEKPFPVLVYGGSTATGTLAIQLLRMSGVEPIVACSPRNFDLADACGAGGKVDYVRLDAVPEIKRLTRGKLKYAYDCIADPASVALCYKTIGRTGGRYVSLEMVPDELRLRRAVRAKVVLGYEGFGEDVPLAKGYASSADPAKRVLVAKYLRALQKYLDEGKLKTHPIQRLGGGLQGVLQGIRLLKSGSVSGQKLVTSL